MLTDEHVAELMMCAWGCASIAPRQAPTFARAIEAAACADRDARIAELERELAELRKQMDAQKDKWLSWDAKRSALEKDAGRYWQLVRLFGVTKLPCLLESVVGDYVADGKQAIDEAIDEAMKGQQ